LTYRIDDVLPDKRALRRSFDRAREFDAACFVHDEARSRLLERLDWLRLTPETVVDLGCATGRAAGALAARYPTARVLAVDSSPAMLRLAAGRVASGIAVVGGDAERLPLSAQRADLIFANLVLASCRPERVFAEASRVLTEGGALLFATLGPDSLAEVRRAFAAADEGIHVHAAFDLHDLGDFAMAAGLAEPVLDVDRLTVTYPNLAALVRDLRATGGVNVAPARRKSLTGKARWARFEAALAAQATERLGITVELILGQAFGRGGASPRSRGGEVAIPIGRIGRPSANT
jgi:malonyl-CoA O-methyltransferase